VWQSVGSENFRYTGARLCAFLSQNLVHHSASFWKMLLQRWLLWTDLSTLPVIVIHSPIATADSKNSHSFGWRSRTLSAPSSYCDCGCIRVLLGLCKSPTVAAIWCSRHVTSNYLYPRSLLYYCHHLLCNMAVVILRHSAYAGVTWTMQITGTWCYLLMV